jgi:hypothetical protein
VGWAGADEPLDARAAKRDARAGLRPRIDVDETLGDGAAAEVGHELGGAVEGLPQPFDVGAALEAIRRVRVQPERPGRPADGAGVEVGALEQHPRRDGGHLGVATAHDAADGDGALGIADHQHVGLERSVLSVERPESLTRPRPPHHDRVLRDGVVPS